jgi:hypothetical protein
MTGAPLGIIAVRSSLVVVLLSAAFIARMFAQEPQEPLRLADDPLSP